MKALILKGKVVQLSEESFEVHPDLTWVNNVPKNLEHGWNYDGTNFSDPDTRTDDEKFNDALKNLRDITKGIKTIADIEAVTWPTKPE